MAEKTVYERSLDLHAEKVGKIEVNSKVVVENKDQLSLAYSPGVAEPCREIHKDPVNVFKYTSKGNLVAVVSDGTAVLGLGDIGPLAAMPVMEGKAILFKNFANVDAFPICLDTKDVDEIVETVKRTGGEVSGPIPLPTEIEKVTILRAVHKYKDSREQFEKRTHKRLIDITNPSKETIEALTHLEIPSGVDIKIIK